MRASLGWIIVGSLVCAPVAVQAASPDILQPVQLHDEAIRFDRGNYVIDLSGQRAAVQLRSLPSDHDYMSFAVTVLNMGGEPINVDTGSIRIEGTQETVRVLTRAEMERKAQRRAGWAKFFTAVGGALVVAGQSNQRNNYHFTTFTPYGFVDTTVSAPCYSCELAAGQTAALTDARLGRIQAALDQTRAALGEQMLQLTTVDPGHAYGGRIFLTQFRHNAPSEMRLIVTVGGEEFAFGFRFAAAGTPLPAYHMAAISRPATASQQPILVASANMAVTPAAANFGPSAVRQPPAASVAVATRSAPARPVGQALPAAHIDQARLDSWRRYYNAALSSGAPKSQAKTMADQEFGPIH